MRARGAEGRETRSANSLDFRVRPAPCVASDTPTQVEFRSLAGLDHVDPAFFLTDIRGRFVRRVAATVQARPRMLA